MDRGFIAITRSDVKPHSYLALLPILVAAVLLSALASPAHSTEAAPEVVAAVPVGAGPWGVAITPDSRRAFIGVSGEDKVSVLDLGSRTVIQEIPTGFGAAGVAMSPDGSFAYVANFIAGNVSKIDTTSYAVTESPQVNPDALSLAVSPNGGFIYVVCEFGQTWRVDANDITAAPVMVADEGGGAFDIAVNATQQVYVGGFHAGNVRIVGDNVRSGALTSSGTAIALSSDGNTAYVGDTGGRFYVFDLTSATWNIPLATYAIGGDIRGIAITPDGRQAYATDRNGDVVRVVDLSDGRVIYTIPVGSGPQRVAISADGLTAVVTNNASDTVSIIAIPARPASGEPGTVPVAPMQQFAIGPDDTCDQLPANFTDFPGISEALLHSRWGKSWAQWPNGGEGGFVCTRQPFYTSSDTWSVR